MRCFSGSDVSARTRSRISKCSIWPGAQLKVDSYSSDGGTLTGSATDLTDIFVVEDPEEPRPQIRSHLPELKLPERPRQAFLNEVDGVDGVMRQTARKSSKIGKNALDLAMQYGLSGIDSFIKADGAAGR